MVRNPVTANDLLIGAHQSIAGGTPRAVERGVAAGCRVLQIFVKNNSRWVGKTIGEAEAREFRRAAQRASLAHVAAHTSYLINLASTSQELRRQSIAALADEILRCHALGIRDLVLHPGAHGGEGEAAGISRHEHIGQGRIGHKGFRNLMTDPRLAQIPKFLETPKDDSLDFDRKNLATLRRLAVARPRRRER